MSQPEAAFVEVTLDRAALIAWLDAPVPRASAWADWRELKGEWYMGNVKRLADLSEEKLAELAGLWDEALAGYASNREAIRAVIATAEEPYLARCVYDEETRRFLVGSMSYGENLDGFVVLLTVARGASRFLAEGDTGLAVIYDFVFGGDEAEIEPIALGIGPGSSSGLLDGARMMEAKAHFQGLADGILADWRKETSGASPALWMGLDELVG